MRRKLFSRRRKMLRINLTCVEALQNAKSAVVQYFEKVIDNVENQRTDTDQLADTELSTMKANIKILGNIYHNLNTKHKITYEGILKFHDLLRGIENKTNLSGVRSFQFPVFRIREFSVELDTCSMLPDHEDSGSECMKGISPTAQNTVAFEDK